MPTKLKRYMVSLPEDLQGMLEKEADVNRRPVANQILWIMDQYYSTRKREANLFTPIPLGEVRRADDTPSFETPVLRDAEQISKIRASVGRDKS